MRRLTALLLTLVYLCVSTGFTVHQHFCMGQFVGAELWHDHGDAHPCDKCGMEKRSSDNGCCKDEHKLIKGDDKHMGAKALTVPVPVAAFVAVVPAGVPAMPKGFAALASAPVPAAHAPPPLWRPPSCALFKRHCNFRI